MTGVYTWSTTASENVQANTGVNWDEGMPPAAVNNSARAIMADLRTQWNDAPWFQYGNGSKNTAPVYASSTSVTIGGSVDSTAYWHTGRRVKAVGSGTGTIYGAVSSSSYSAPNTTVNFTWDSGSLSNETLSLYAGLPVTGKPLAADGLGDYKKGTWTPVFSCGTTPPTGVTYSAQTGVYTKIGNVVHVSFNLSVTSIGTGGVGTGIITGLPFTSANNGVSSIGAGYVTATTLDAGYTQFVFHIAANTSQIEVREEGSGVNAQGVVYANFPGASTAVLRGSITYFSS